MIFLLFWVPKSEEIGNTMLDKSTGRKRTSKANMNVERVRQYVMDDPRKSLRLRLYAVSPNLQKFTLHRILDKSYISTPTKLLLRKIWRSMILPNESNSAEQLEITLIHKSAIVLFCNFWWLISIYSGALNTNMTLVLFHHARIFCKSQFFECSICRKL